MESHVRLQLDNNSYCCHEQKGLFITPRKKNEREYGAHDSGGKTINIYVCFLFFCVFNFRKQSDPVRFTEFASNTDPVLLRIYPIITIDCHQQQLSAPEYLIYFVWWNSKKKLRFFSSFPLCDRITIISAFFQIRIFCSMELTMVFFSLYFTVYNLAKVSSDEYV